MSRRPLLALSFAALAGALGAATGCAISLEPDLRDLPDASGDHVDVSNPDAPNPDAPPNPDVQPCRGGPRPEACNGIDDDCNGLIDDGLGNTACGVGQCFRTVPACVNGQPAPCSPGQPAREACNGLDDDCDGLTDNNGACVDGGPVCLPEICNGLDDDCDGVIDNGLGLSACGVGACQRTVQNCINGVTQMCVPGVGTMEVCDGIDNDCNGVADDNNVCGSCPRSLDPLDGWFYRPGVEVVDIDETEFGSGIVTALLGALPPGDQTPMVQRAGDCIYDPVGMNSPRDLNLGTIRAQQSPSLDQSLLYNTSSQHYDQPMPVMLDALNASSFVLLHVAGGPDGPLTDSRMLPPPALRSTQISWPTGFTRGQSLTVGFAAQSDAPDLQAVFMVFDGMGQSTAVCTVPVCRGSVTVPGAITASFQNAQQVGYLRVVRTQLLPQYATPVRFRASFGVAHILNAQ